jgi:5-methylcytosine-specific restriction endonuclease McrA
MPKDLQKLRKVYDRTNGACHICYKKLSFSSHGKRGYKGAWHVDHSKPRIYGGTDRLNNLYAACISCNIEKSTSSSRSARSKHGYTRAPYSKAKKDNIRNENTATGAIIGGILGSFAGSLGIAIGATIGGAIGKDVSPKK